MTIINYSYVAIEKGNVKTFKNKCKWNLIIKHYITEIWIIKNCKWFEIIFSWNERFSLVALLLLLSKYYSKL